MPMIRALLCFVLMWEQYKIAQQNNVDTLCDMLHMVATDLLSNEHSF